MLNINFGQCISNLKLLIFGYLSMCPYMVCPYMVKVPLYGLPLYGQSALIWSMYPNMTALMNRNEANLNFYSVFKLVYAYVTDTLL